MFLVSAALVGVAIVLLLLGMIMAKLTLVYLAIGVSVVSMILLGIGIFLQRELLWGRERTPAGETATGKPEDAGEPVDAGEAGEAGEEPEVAGAGAARATAGPAPAVSGSTAPDTPTAAPGEFPVQAWPARAGAGDRPVSGGLGDEPEPGEPDPALLVRVVPGRRRYHRPGCSSLAGRASDELTVDEAREEGFSACTACFPDLAETPGGSAERAWRARADSPPEPAAPADAGAGEPAAPEPAAPAAQAEPSPAVGDPEEQVTPAHGMAIGEPAEAPGESRAVAGEAAAADEVPGHEAAGAAQEEGAADKAPGDDAAGDDAVGDDAAGPASSGETVWVVRGVSRYHRSDCVLIRSVDEDDVDTMTRADAETAGCTPCRACHVVAGEPLVG